MSRFMHGLFTTATALAAFCVWALVDTLVNHQPQTLSRAELESGIWMLYAVCGAVALKIVWKWVCTVRQVYFRKTPPQLPRRVDNTSLNKLLQQMADQARRP